MANSSLTAIFARLVASGLGSGFAPKAPGTVGTFACFVLWFASSVAGIPGDVLSGLLIFGLCSVLGLITTRICLTSYHKAEGAAGKEIDPQYIVIDEWSGLLLALVGLSYNEPILAILAFVLFRLFDITKPGPVRWFESLPGEWGIMLDDICAGAFAYAIVMTLRSAL